MKYIVGVTYDDTEKKWEVEFDEGTTPDQVINNFLCWFKVTVYDELGWEVEE